MLVGKRAQLSTARTHGMRAISAPCAVGPYRRLIGLALAPQARPPSVTPEYRSLLRPIDKTCRCSPSLGPVVRGLLLCSAAGELSRALTMVRVYRLARSCGGCAERIRVPIGALHL
jgi:hypothetical protein